MTGFGERMRACLVSRTFPGHRLGCVLGVTWSSLVSAAQRLTGRHAAVNGTVRSTAEEGAEDGRGAARSGGSQRAMLREGEGEGKSERKAEGEAVVDEAWVLGLATIGALMVSWMHEREKVRGGSEEGACAEFLVCGPDI